MTPAWGSGNLGDNSGSPFGYKGQRGAYTDQESQHIILVGHAPYVPAAPTYVAPNALHDNNPYQPMSGNPIGSGAPYDEYAPVAGGPDDVPSHQDLYKPFMDAAHQVAESLKTALEVAAIYNPICQTLEIIFGQNAAGCKISNGERVFTAATMLLPHMPNLNLLKGTRILIKGYGKIAANITKKHGLFQCKQCASELIKAFKKIGVPCERITLKNRGQRRYIWSNTYNGSISEDGTHMGVKVGNTVYDNVHKNGIPYQQWISDFESPYGFDIVSDIFN